MTDIISHSYAFVTIKITYIYALLCIFLKKLSFVQKNFKKTIDYLKKMVYNKTKVVAKYIKVSQSGENLVKGAGKCLLVNINIQ